MREQLNSNPLAQLAVVGALLVGVGFFLLSSSGGGEEEESGSTEATVSVAGSGATGTATGATGAAAVPAQLDAPPPPPAVSTAYEANRTVVLLVVRNGGIDDRVAKAATAGVAGLRDVALFVVPAGQISRYAAITEGAGVEQVPALVVVSPKGLKQTVPTASVSYGFQSPQNVVQAVIDAGYKGPTVDYHP